MFKTLLTILAALVLAPLASAQTVDEIIARNIQAHGGMEKLKSVATARQTAKLVGAFRAEIVREGKRPDKVRDEFIIQGMASTSAYDGKVGWRVNPFGGRRDAEMLSEDDTKGLVEEADIDGPLVDYQQKGNKAELMGHDSVEGTDCYKVKLTWKNGDVWIYYLDADSYLELKLETQTTIRGAIQEGDVPGIETGNPDHHPRGNPGGRTVFRGLRQSRRPLLPVRARIRTEGRSGSPKNHRGEGRVECAARRFALLNAGWQAGDQGSHTRQVRSCCMRASNTETQRHRGKMGSVGKQTTSSCDSRSFLCVSVPLCLILRAL